MFKTLLSLSSWSDYFTGIDAKPDYKYIQVLNRIVRSGEAPFVLSFYITNCYFYDIHHIYAGGAISIQRVTNFMLESTSLEKCYATTSTGGALHINCLDQRSTDSVVSKTCFSGCYLFCAGASKGQTCNIQIKNRNIFEESSTIGSFNDDPNSIAPIYLLNGDVSFQRNNVSCNYVGKYSAIRCFDIYSSKVWYTAFTNCTSHSLHLDANNSFSLSFEVTKAGTKNTFKTCNFFRNNATGGYLIFAAGDQTILDSSFFFNTCNRVVYNWGIVLMGCSLDNATGIGHNKSPAASNFINAFQLLNTELCPGNNVYLFPTNPIKIVKTCKYVFQRNLFKGNRLNLLI